MPQLRENKQFKIYKSYLQFLFLSAQKKLDGEKCKSNGELNLNPNAKDDDGLNIK